MGKSQPCPTCRAVPPVSQRDPREFIGKTVWYRPHGEPRPVTDTVVDAKTMETFSGRTFTLFFLANGDHLEASEFWFESLRA